MKKTLLILAIISASFSTNAQTGKKEISHDDARANANRFLYQLLLHNDVVLNTASKTTTTYERLIGESEYDDQSGIIVDSFALAYSGGIRGSVFNWTFLSYLTTYGPSFDGINNDIFGYANTTGLKLPHNLAWCTFSDSTRAWIVSPLTSTYGYFSTEGHTYDANNNLIDALYKSPGIKYQHDICQYNTLSNVTYSLELVDNTGTGAGWDSVSQELFFYNSTNLLVTDSIGTFVGTPQNWAPGEKYTYVYDGSNNLILATAYFWGPSWILDHTFTMTYYPGTHDLKTFENDTYPVSAAIPAYKDSFGYTPGVNHFTYEKQEQYDGSGALSDMSISQLHQNSLGLTDTMNAYDYSTGSTIVSRSMGIWTYNTFNDPVKLVSVTGTGSGIPTTPYGTTFYYYGTYTDVAQISSGNNIKIFPNPGTSTASINFPGYVSNEKITISIFNMLGQKTNCFILRWHQETEQISIADLVPGNYLITIQDERNNILHRQQLVKQ